MPREEAEAGMEEGGGQAMATAMAEAGVVMGVEGMVMEGVGAVGGVREGHPGLDRGG